VAVGSITPRRILVTGVGGAPGFDLARSLIRLGCEVIGVDANPLAPGLLLPGVIARTLPPSTHSEYRPNLLRICGSLRPEALLPGTEDELSPLLTLRQSLEGLGVAMWLPSGQAVEFCTDKAAFHQALTTHGVPTPRTVLPLDLDQLPDIDLLVVKPRRGHGTQNVHVCRTREQARVLCELVPDAIVQEHVTGREFTADCLVDRAGCASVILRYRHLVKGGLSVVSTTFHDVEVAEQVRATLTAVGAAGVCCAQGFIRDEPGSSRVVMTEVNPRIAGGFLAAEAAGADLVGQLLNGLAGLPVDHDRLQYKPDVCLTKYTETLAVTEGTQR
jgi:carbamoyl-phosphate synthase large subunit